MNEVRNNWIKLRWVFVLEAAFVLSAGFNEKHGAEKSQRQRQKANFTDKEQLHGRMLSSKAKKVKDA